MVRLSNIIKSNPKSRKEQLKRKIKMLERGKSFRDSFLNDRKQLDKELINMEINEERTNIFLLRNQFTSLTQKIKGEIAKIHEIQKSLRRRMIELVRDALENALRVNESFNEYVKDFIKSSCLDPFDFDEFWDVIMKDFIEVYLKGLPEYILTSSILIDFWEEKVNEMKKCK